jgi:hypothetical protein
LGKEIAGGFKSFDFVLRIKREIMLQHAAIPYIIFHNKDFKGMMVFHICVYIGYDSNVESTNLFPY